MIDTSQFINARHFCGNPAECQVDECFACGADVCAESFTESRRPEGRGKPICEDCATNEALVDYFGRER